MQELIGKILKVEMADGRIFAARLTAVLGETLVFENSKGAMSFNKASDIVMVHEVV